jgi:hypothetical protein
MRYFEFDMLEKHSREHIDYISSWIWLVILIIIGYTIYKLFEKYDR